MRSLKTGFKILILGLWVSAFIGACASFSRSTSNLALSVEVDRHSYQIGQPVPITLILENSSSAPVVIQTRMALNVRQLCPNVSCDLYFAISDSANKELEFRWLARVRSIELTDFRKIMPGERYRFELPDLTVYYAPFDKPGQYTIQAVYENQMDPNDGGLAWKGRLTSNVATVTLEPQT